MLRPRPTPVEATTSPSRWPARLRAWLPPLVLLGALLAGWELWVRVRGVEPYVLPAPSRIWPAFWEARPLLGPHLRTTLTETVLGVVLGAALGAVLAIAIATVPLLRRALQPLLVASQTIPLIVLAPLLVLWFGFGMAPKVVIVVLIVFFPVAISTAGGLMSADAEQVDLVRSLGANRRQVLRLVTVPSALPSFFSGLRISSAYAVAGAVYGELIGGSSGLGLFIERSRRSYRVDQVLVAVVLIALLSAALFGLVHLASRLLTPWTAATDTRAATDARAAGVRAASDARAAAHTGPPGPDGPAGPHPHPDTDHLDRADEGGADRARTDGAVAADTGPGAEAQPVERTP